MSPNDDFWNSRDPATQEVLNAARIVAATDATTLILGDSGTGKARLARAIHGHSPRHAAPFVRVDCGTLNDDRPESLMVGQRGGADTDSPHSYDGTLFLDKIDELDRAMQAKLLRFIESGELGSRPVDVRIIAASHRDLAQSVADGHFRRDLYYRLNVVPLRLPALRDRCADIPHLIKRLFDELAARHHQPPVRLDSAAMHALIRHDWPGNIRELRNLCERLAILMPGGLLGLNNLPSEYREPSTHRVDPLIELPGGGLVLAEVERDLIQQALARTQGNRSKAARLLGLTRDTLLYRLKKFALN